MKCLRVVFGTLYVFYLAVPTVPATTTAPSPRPLAVEREIKKAVTGRQTSTQVSAVSFLNAHYSFVLDNLFTKTMSSIRKLIFFLTNSFKSNQGKFPFYFQSLQQCLSLSLSILSSLTLNPLVPSLNLSSIFPLLLIVLTFSISGMDHHLFTISLP